MLASEVIHDPPPVPLRRGSSVCADFCLIFFVEGRKITNNLTKPKTFLISYLKVIFNVDFFLNNSLC